MVSKSQMLLVKILFEIALDKSLSDSDKVYAIKDVCKALTEVYKEVQSPPQ